jgi:hypothetical protein
MIKPWTMKKNSLNTFKYQRRLQTIFLPLRRYFRIQKHQVMSNSLKSSYLASMICRNTLRQILSSSNSTLSTSTNASNYSSIEAPQQIPNRSNSTQHILRSNMTKRRTPCRTVCSTSSLTTRTLDLASLPT